MRVSSLRDRTALCQLPAFQQLRAFCFLSAVLLALTLINGQAQEAKQAPNYTRIVVFGDSLSDTGNVAHLTEAKYGFRVPGPIADYTDGRFTDGADTQPRAKKYFGVWIEQLAATLASKPVIKDSLDGGTNFAYGFAFTGDGTSVLSFGPSNAFSVKVKNIGQQVTDYLGTHPKITDKTLFVVWGGANDLLNATSDDDVIDAGLNQTLNVERLIHAGATQFLVPNLPPLGLVPRFNGSSKSSVPATKAARLYNQVLDSGLGLLRASNQSKHIQIVQLDVFGLLNKIVASPAKFELKNVKDSSQGLNVDPDTYLFWDSLHPTTRGHNLLAQQAREILAGSATEEDADAVSISVPR